ncbi:hypothetical protein HWI79_1409 [Cryptosporidium felis]|nr:hypothetical protein HWI79_1409 [Cryptosporidium felis]
MVDAQDNQFFRCKPSTRIHHPPGGASSLGIGYSTLNAHGKNSEGSIDKGSVHTDSNNLSSNTENNDSNSQLQACQTVEMNSDIVHTNNNNGNNGLSSGNLKTNVKVHNPPGGKSSFSLY